MPRAAPTDRRFLPVGVTAGSGQEVGRRAGLVVVALYCLSGDLF